MSPHTASSPRWNPLALGFRPFFLLAGISAFSLLTLWLLIWRGVVAAPAYFEPVSWHSHEMLFGYGVAVVSGFLLTAVRNWTGQATWTGWRLGVLVVFWTLGRILPWLPGVPVWLTMSTDIAFLPLLTLSLVRPLWRGESKANRLFIALLLAMSLANLLSQLQTAGVVTGVGDMRRVMIDLLLLLIVVVAGRVMPFFARSALTEFVPRRLRIVEAVSPLMLLLLVAIDFIGLRATVVVGTTWCLFGLVQAFRLAGWFDRRISRIPVLWVLYTAYAWIVVGALLLGCARLGLLPESPALHALTVGAIGVFTLGMMARVTRGHTGRNIDVPRSTALAFVLMNLAAIVRAGGPLLDVQRYQRWIDMSALLWISAFVIFLAGYGQMLLAPRVDGKPG